MTAFFIDFDVLSVTFAFQYSLYKDCLFNVLYSELFAMRVARDTVMRFYKKVAKSCVSRVSRGVFRKWRYKFFKIRVCAHMVVST